MSDLNLDALVERLRDGADHEHWTLREMAYQAITVLRRELKNVEAEWEEAGESNTKEIRKLRAALEARDADVAAMVEGFERYGYGHLDGCNVLMAWHPDRAVCDCGRDALLTADHPGADLLDRLRRAEAVVEEVPDFPWLPASDGGTEERCVIRGCYPPKHNGDCPLAAAKGREEATNGS